MTQSFNITDSYHRIVEEVDCEPWVDAAHLILGMSCNGHPRARAADGTQNQDRRQE